MREDYNRQRCLSVAKGCLAVLKAYGVEELRQGMKVGRNILDGDNAVLIEKGKVLTTDMIDSLLDRPIFSVYIEEEIPDTEKEIPGKEHLLDDAYVNRYDMLYNRVHMLYANAAEKGRLDEAELNGIVDEDLPPLLQSAAKAVSQIHNMSREGIYLIHHVLHVAILAGLMGQWLNRSAAKRR